MIQIPRKFYLVTGDHFELFYRGAIRKYNPYEYYVKANCEKGYTYNRKFTYTPKEGEEGEYEISITMYDDDGNILESEKSILVVNKPEKPKRKLNVLCIGDSETVNGQWPYTVYERFTDLFPNSLNFIGKMKRDEIGYEGYGGWQWKTFCFDETESRTSSVWIDCKHNLTDVNIHSKWSNNSLEWILETIKPNKLKFKRGFNNTKVVNPKIEGYMESLDNLEKIYVQKYEYSDANPFWNNDTKELDFKKYIKDNNFDTPDIVLTFLTGNGLYIPYAKTIPHHEKYCPLFLKTLHEVFPNALIGVMGIELPCVNGGVTACYGANGYYHDWYAYLYTVFTYNKWLEEFTLTHSDYMMYSDMKCQFDCENNYPYEMEKVNNRSQVLEKIGVNGLHPTNEGYKQIGDAFYRFLVEIIKKFNRTRN